MYLLLCAKRMACNINKLLTVEVSYGRCYFVVFCWIGDIRLSSPVIRGIAKKAHKYDRDLRSEYSRWMEFYWLGCGACLGIS